MSRIWLAPATTGWLAVSLSPRRRATSSSTASSRLAKGPDTRSMPTPTRKHQTWRGSCTTNSRHRARATTTKTSTTAPPEEHANIAKLLKLLRANAYVELVGFVAVAVNPDVVFPEISRSVAGAECARWCALTLAVVALASFVCAAMDKKTNAPEFIRLACLPTTASMALYHLGISAFQLRSIVANGFSAVAGGALSVHLPLAAAFCVATKFCATEEVDPS